MTTNIFGTVANIWLLFNDLMRFLYISISDLIYIPHVNLVLCHYIQFYNSY